jgi:hypothetical protein
MVSCSAYSHYSTSLNNFRGASSRLQICSKMSIIGQNREKLFTKKEAGDGKVVAIHVARTTILCRNHVMITIAVMRIAS